MSTNIYTLRYVARITLEAVTPMALGSGEESLTTDRLVARDICGLPFIPGTSLTGVLRSCLLAKLQASEIDDLFGYQGGKNNDDDATDGVGSRLIISSAHFVGKQGKVYEGLEQPDWSDEFYARYRKLPVRDHVRINDKGAKSGHGKFDEEVVFAGTRFVFELELKGKESDERCWQAVIDSLASSGFRLGGGSRNGFGEMKVVKVAKRCYNLCDEKDLHCYMDKSASLEIPFNGEKIEPIQDNTGYIHYRLELHPDDLFLFGSAHGSDRADMTPVKEAKVVWEEEQTPKFTEDLILIPATSIKGAIAHRTAFHYNKKKQVFADMLAQPDSINHLLKEGYFRSDLCRKFKSSKYSDRVKLATVYNPAVMDLFGYSLENEDETELLYETKEKGQDKSRGRVLMSDVFEVADKKEYQLLNHVKIDRFTGSAIDGALFGEEVVNSKKLFCFDIYVKWQDASTPQYDEDKLVALENALKDITCGLLPLGGGTMRGHGCFHGKLIKNGKEKNS